VKAALDYQTQDHNKLIITVVITSNAKLTVVILIYNQKVV